MSKIKHIDVNGTLYNLSGTEGVVFDTIYPVGSIYINTTNIDPAPLFGGTWTRLKDRMLYLADNNVVSGSTGGAASVSYTPAGTVGSHTLTTDEIPSHNHSFTGSEVTSGNQSAGHTHSYTEYYATTTSSTALSASTSPSHNHGYGSSGWKVDHTHARNSGACLALNGDWAGGAGGNTNNNGSSSGHTHSGANTHTSRNTTDNSANHTHSITADGSIGNTGGGKGHNHGFTGTATTLNTMPPYLVVYVWQRTA